MKEDLIENIIMIVEDVKLSYADDRFIKDRLGRAIKRLRELQKQIKK